MNNPLFILQTLDRQPDHPVELTLYGRAALAHLRLPDIQELRDAFRDVQPKVLALARAVAPGRPPPA